MKDYRKLTLETWIGDFRSWMVDWIYIGINKLAPNWNRGHKDFISLKVNLIRVYLKCVYSYPNRDIIFLICQLWCDLLDKISTYVSRYNLVDSRWMLIIFWDTTLLYSHFVIVIIYISLARVKFCENYAAIHIMRIH